MLRNQTVNYNKLAQGFPKELDLSSHLRRIQRFFAEVTFDEKDFSKLLSKMIPVKGKYKLSMDRTNWKFGSLNINLLYLSVIYDGVGIPILWSVLGDKRGNSNTEERKDLMERFIQLFGVEKIEYLTADREFVGYHWWNFLLEKKIQFNIRFRQNFYVVLKNGKTTQAKNLLCQKGLQSLYCH
ncbi:IS4 family transposase, partial [Flammeovirga aprica JL-4]|nr:IS4 family transposase [Flammeovirga aprica JL-4]